MTKSLATDLLEGPPSVDRAGSNLRSSMDGKGSKLVSIGAFSAVAVAVVGSAGEIGRKDIAGSSRGPIDG